MTPFGVIPSSSSPAAKRIWAAGKKRQADKSKARYRETLQLRLAAEVQNRQSRLRREIDLAVAAAEAERAYRERPTGAMIVERVCAKHGVDVKLVLSHTRTVSLVIPRQETFWRLRTELGWPLTKIGKLMRRDHTTVMYGIRMHEQRVSAK